MNKHNEAANELESLRNLEIKLDAAPSAQDQRLGILWCSQLMLHLYTLNLTEWEQDFVYDISIRLKQHDALTKPQLDTLAKIHLNNKEWL